MTLAKSKDTLAGFIKDQENKVVALSGKWGTGKSHLWRELQKESIDTKVSDAIYISLFGVGSIGDLKLKAVQGVLPKIKDGGPAVETAKRAVTTAKKILQGFHSGFSALNDLALLALPTLLKNRFIVIDDIERRHRGLTIEELLGFIDDGVQNLNCRFLLILNDDKLDSAASSMWQEFHEKLIDQELRLDTSPSEALHIALTNRSVSWSSHILAAVEACDINNIRVIHKIVRLIERILGDGRSIEWVVFLRVVPPTVLLAAIHYKVLKDGPDAKFVLNYQQRYAWQEEHKVGEENKEERDRRRWTGLLERMQIRSSDEFESDVYGYLQTGMLDDLKVRDAIDRFVESVEILRIQNDVQGFLGNAEWNVHAADAVQLNIARTFLPLVGQLDAQVVTALANYVEQLKGGGDLARQLILDWTISFRRRHASLSQPASAYSSDRILRQKIHPYIADEIVKLRERVLKNTSWDEVFQNLNIGGPIGELERAFMKIFPREEYIKILREGKPQDMKLLLVVGVNLVAQRQIYEQMLGEAPQRFLDACQTVINGRTNPKLIKLIQKVFAEKNIVMRPIEL